MKNVIYKPFIYDSDESENDFSITPPRGYKSRYTKYEDEEDIIEDIIYPKIEEPEKPKEIDFSLPDINYRFPDKESFKTRMLQEYRSALQAHGIDPSYAKALVAQDALESAWGSKPSGLYNYGGIKGNGKTLTTTEHIDGEYINVNDSFRNFDSIQEYVNYKINLLNGSRYKAFSGDIKDFSKRVASGGYATAPNYAHELDKVIRSMRRGGILKFDKGGKDEANEYLDNNRTHYNKKIGEFSFLPPFNLPYNIAKHNIGRINIVSGLPEDITDPTVIAAYENNSRTIYDTSNDSYIIRHEIGHALFNELEKNVESLINKYDGDIYLDGVSKDEYYDSPREIIARVWTHLKDVDYKGNMSTRDTLRFIQDERDRVTTDYRADIRRADGSRTRSTHNSNGIKVHDSVSRGDIDFDNSKVYRTYNDRNHIIDRYKDSFILDLYQLIYEMNDNVQYARFGTKLEHPIYNFDLPPTDIRDTWIISKDWHAPLLVQYENSKPGANGDVDGFKKAKDVYEYILTLPGSNPAIAAGWTGVFMKESGLNHNAVSSKGATGIAQLLGTRRNEYKRWLRGRPDNWQNQINWVWEKVNRGKDDWQEYYDALKYKVDNGIRLSKTESEHWNSMKNSKYINFSFKNYRDKIQNITDPGDIAELMTWTFERPGESEAHINQRKGYAQNVYNQFNYVDNTR